MPDRVRWDRPWVFVAIVIAAHLATAALYALVPWPGTWAGLTGLPLDDSWIHLVYARAVAAFDGFCYNPGVPEAGFTSPLWVVLLAPLFWLKSLVDFSIVYGVKVVGLGVAVATSLLAARLARRLSGSRAAGWVAALLVAVDPSLCFAKLSGMEVLLASTVVLWGLDALLGGREIEAAFAAALAPTARPELATFTVIALGVLAVRLARRHASAWRWVAVALPSMATIGGWIAFCLAATGRPLPSTFYAKHAATSGWSSLSDLPVVFGSMLFDLPWFFLGSGVVLFAMGAWAIARPRPVDGSPADRLPRLAVVGVPIVFLVGVAWAHQLSESWPFYWNRYFQPTIPWLLVAVAIGAVRTGRWSRERLRGSIRVAAWQRAAAVAGVVVLLLPLAVLPLRLIRQAELFAWNCQNINEMEVDIGRWVALHSTSGDWIATNDAGAIRFVGGRRVVDMAGPNNHFVEQRGLDEVLGQTRPRYYAIFPFLYPWISRSRSFVPVHMAQASRYTVCDCNESVMVVYAPAPAEATAGGRGAATGEH